MSEMGRWRTYGHLLQVALPTLEQSVLIQARRVFDRAGKALEAGKVGRKLGFEVRKRGGDQLGNAIRVAQQCFDCITASGGD